MCPPLKIPRQNLPMRSTMTIFDGTMTTKSLLAIFSHAIIIIIIIITTTESSPWQEWALDSI